MIYNFETVWASLGLLLFRLTCSAALIWDAWSHVWGKQLGADSIFHLLQVLLSVFLAAGYRTHWIGGIIAAIEIWLVVFGAGDPLIRILLAAFAMGLSLLGPGSWSMDARISGWKRIEIPKR